MVLAEYHQNTLKQQIANRFILTMFWFDCILLTPCLLQPCFHVAGYHESVHDYVHYRMTTCDYTAVKLTVIILIILQIILMVILMIIRLIIIMTVYLSLYIYIYMYMPTWPATLFYAATTPDKRPYDLPTCAVTYAMIQYAVWYDMIWYDMIWYDMIGRSVAAPSAELPQTGRPLLGVVSQALGVFPNRLYVCMYVCMYVM